jgi:DNA-directed RNA polymerase specialized sigma24 family protein
LALHQRIDGESAARALYAELTRLPTGEWAVLQLVAPEGLSAGEAGRALGIVTRRRTPVPRLDRRRRHE